MSKLRYKEGGVWKSIAPSQKEFDDNKAEVTVQLAEMDTDKAEQAFVVSELSTKATKGQIIAADLATASDGDKIKLINLSEEVQAALSGTAPVISSVTNLSLTKEKYADKSVSRNKTNFYSIVSKNKFNKIEVVSGGYYSEAGGTFTAHASISSSGLIGIAEGDTIYLKHSGNITYWGANLNFVSGAVSATSHIVPTGTGIKYFRIAITNTNIPTQMITINETIPAVYEEYRVSDPQLLIKKENLAADVFLQTGAKLTRPSDGRVTFTVPVNQYIVDKSSTLTTVIDNETTFENVPGVLFLPVSYATSGKKTPLIMMAHGHGEYVTSDGTWGTNTAWIGWKDKLVTAGYAVFDVNGYGAEIQPDSKHWGSPRAIEAYFKAYLWAIENYNLDERIFITGGSMGGLTALNFANAHSNIARCVLAYAPCTDFLNQKMSGAGWESEYMTSYGITTLANVAGWTPINMKQLNVPLKIWHGTGDTVLNYTYSQTLIDNLKANNSPCEIRLIEGAGHNVAYGNNTVIDESLMHMNRYK